MCPLSALVLFGPGDADQVALGVGEVADRQACRCPFGAHLAFAAQALGLGQAASTFGTRT